MSLRFNVDLYLCDIWRVIIDSDMLTDRSELNGDNCHNVVCQIKACELCLSARAIMRETRITYVM